MKILFLDVDGVLNSETWFKNVKPTDEDYLGLRSIDPEAVKRLLHVLERTQANVVLSSTWRLVDDYVETLRGVGIPLTMMTPRLANTSNRGAEIAAWLKVHPGVDKFAIVDDDEDAGDHGLRPWLVQTSWSCGITDRDAAELIAKLS